VKLLQGEVLNQLLRKGLGLVCCLFPNVLVFRLLSFSFGRLLLLVHVLVDLARLSHILGFAFLLFKRHLVDKLHVLFSFRRLVFSLHHGLLHLQSSHLFGRQLGLLLPVQRREKVVHHD